MLTLARSSVLLAAMLIVCTPSAQAVNCGGSCNASNASAVMSEGLGLVVAGSLSAVAASGQVAIEALEKTDDAVILIVTSVSEAGKASATLASEVTTASIKLTGKTIEKMAFVVGQTLEISVVSTGYFLVYSGKALAFIPNEVGQALIGHEKVKS